MIHPIPSGTRDVLPDETREARAITDALRAVFERHGYGEVYTPALEYESVLGRADMAEARPAYRVFDETGAVLGWYDAIVGAVTEITAGRDLPADGTRSFGQLRARLLEVIDGADRSSVLAAAASSAGLGREEIVSNAAVLLFGGIETTEGMIATSALHLLERPRALERVRADPDLIAPAIEESLRLEPAAAVIDRYATADVRLAGAQISSGELVRISLAAANRDPEVFDAPDRFDLDRGGAGRHVAFAQGPHVCVGVHLAWLEARTALAALLSGLPGLRLNPRHEPAVRGLVFRKPQTLHVVWDR